MPNGAVEPSELVPRPSKSSNYYLPALVLGGALWLTGLLMILFYGRGKNKRPTQGHVAPTLADRLEPLVAAAVKGEITTEQQAELERLLTSFWSRKLRLGHLPAAKLRINCRTHPQAGQLLQKSIIGFASSPGQDADQMDVLELLEAVSIGARE